MIWWINNKQIHSHQLNNNEDGTINLEDIKNSIRNVEDPHYPRSKLVCLENTHNICYGAPIDENYFSDVKNIIEKHNLQLHPLSPIQEQKLQNNLQQKLVS